MQPPSRRTVYVMLVLVMLFWSGNSVVARALRNDVPPFTLAALWYASRRIEEMEATKAERAAAAKV